ncbi:MAG: lasso peptide biosynthesis B2 protein [Mucilaginibacter sp.]
MIINKLTRKVNTFRRLPMSVILLFIEALFTSAWVKMSLKFFPFKRVLGWLGSVHQESDNSPSEETLETRLRIKKALYLCHKYALWPTECYTLSLTGKLLLRRRNLSGTIYIGFMKDEHGKFKGHAWLRANDTYLSGLREARGFDVKLLFS